MSNEAIDDGGPAFPRAIHEEYDRVNDHIHPENGMTLRDWFAGQALVGMLYHGEGFEDEGAAAEWAYKQADALLKARKQ